MAGVGSFFDGFIDLGFSTVIHLFNSGFDQGAIMQSFLYSSTLIITPDKVYDPTEDSDSEFFEIVFLIMLPVKKPPERAVAVVVLACSRGNPDHNPH